MDKLITHRQINMNETKYEWNEIRTHGIKYFF